MTLTLRLLTTMLVGFLVNLGLTPLIIHLAHRNQWYDELNHRKIHTEDIPRLGGVGIFVALLAAMLVGFAVGQGEPSGAQTGSVPGSYFGVLVHYLPIIGGMIVIFLVGLVDDFRNLRALLKLVIQIVAAVIVTLGPFRIEQITIPFIWYTVELGFFSYPVTVVWIVAISNAVNFIDGIDGLAGGSSAIATLFFAVAALLVGQEVPSLVAIGLFGSLLAFLVYNGPPARIFMGDSGSYVLGFSLSVMPLVLARGSVGHLMLLPAVTILAVPVIDMTTAIFRRMRRGKHPFSADREHIHHRLMDIGLGTWRILTIVYATGIVMGLAGVSWYLLPKNLDMVVILVLWAVLITLVAFLSRAVHRKSEE